MCWTPVDWQKAACVDLYITVVLPQPCWKHWWRTLTCGLWCSQHRIVWRTTPHVDVESSRLAFCSQKWQNKLFFSCFDWDASFFSSSSSSSSVWPHPPALICVWEGRRDLMMTQQWSLLRHALISARLASAWAYLCTHIFTTGYLM